MSNIDFTSKHVSFGSARIAGRTGKQKLQLALNVALIAAAFLFVSAAVLGVFP